jgi:hypothetical protein
MRFDTVTTALVFFLIGTATSPYLTLAFEFLLSRPRRISKTDYFDACGKDCNIR